MSEDRAKVLIERAGRLASDRGTAESHWQEIAELFTPMRADFNQRVATPGEKRMTKVFDGTPGQAAENLSSALWGMLTNSANIWFELRPRDPGLAEQQEVKAWLEHARDRMLAVFAAGGQRFYARAVDLYSDLVNFGTGIFYEEEAPAAGGIYFTCRHLAECYIAENQYEQVDTVFRRFRWTARQAMQRWKDSAGPKLRATYEKTPDQAETFLHAVLPVEDYDGEKKLDAAMRWASVYVCEADSNILSEGGYHDFPYQVPRWSQRSRSVYGDSPAMLALPDAKMLNQMSRTTIVGAQKAVDPPILAPDEGTVRGVRIGGGSRGGIRTASGGIVYGGMDSQGRRMYDVLHAAGNIGLGLDMEEQRRTAIREAFYASLLLLASQPGRTATEVLALQEEKLRLMGPHLGRVQSEFLDPLIGRVFGIMMRAGRIERPPMALAEAPELDVEYVSPMARAQRATEAVAVVRSYEVGGLIAQATGNTDALDNLNPDEAMRIAADANGLPATAMRSLDEVEQVRQQRQAVQAAMMASEQAPKVAGAVKDMADARKTAEAA